MATSSGADADFAEDPLKGLLEGVGADVELLADLLVVEVLGDEAGDF